MTSDEIKKARDYIVEHCMDGYVARGWLDALAEIERLRATYEGCLTAPYAAELGKQYDEMQAEAEAWKAAAYLNSPEFHHISCNMRRCDCGRSARALKTARALESDHD